ncbi:MAG: hypothetical protein EPO24_08515 [Bacteroidetes bacterium]|nr:MAG: hypothetical protein EPO24_08515 [Bacteroidota bacterium]
MKQLLSLIVLLSSIILSLSFKETAIAQWQMFHKDERHTGLVTEGVGNIPLNGLPSKRWEFKVAEPPESNEGTRTYRFYSNFPLVDLDGNGSAEVIITGPDLEPGRDRGKLQVLTTTSATSATYLWTPFEGNAGGDWGCSDWFDQYAAATVNCDDEPNPDIVLSAKRGVIRAISGISGAVIWEYTSNRFTEAGPMIADLDRDGVSEIIIVMGLPINTGCTPDGPALIILKSQRDTLNGQLIREIEFPNKLDSEEPAIVDLNPLGGSNSKTIVFGSWSNINLPDKSGSLYAVWFDLTIDSLQNAPARIDSILLEQIAQGTDGEVQSEEIPVFRSSPMIWNFGDGETAIFTWMGDFTNITSSRISAVGLSYNQINQEVEFTPKWTTWYIPIDTVSWPVMDWKPTVALLPRPGRDTLIVSAGGRGSSLGSQSGDYGYCTDSAIGWVGAFKPNGEIAWANRYVNEGNIRSSCAVADIDNDGRYETMVAFGCRGMFRCYDDSGNMKWEYQLGTNSSNEWTQRSICSPSIGDVDGDGSLEVIVSAFDGYVTCLGGPAASSLVTRNYPVNDKWNLVSVPLQVTTNSKDSLFPTAQSGAFAFQGTYIEHGVLENGVGYWLKFNGNQKIQMTGYEIHSDSIDVFEGWNLIGSISSPVQISSILTEPHDNIDGNMFEYNNGYRIASEIEPGKSYWVKAKHDGTIYLISTMAGNTKIKLSKK